MQSVKDLYYSIRVEEYISEGEIGLNEKNEEKNN